MTQTTHFRTCPLCEAMCGLEIRVTDGRVDRIRGDHDDVWSKGYLCPKGTALGHLHHDPDRVRTPMIRTGDRWTEVDWDTAFPRCDELLAGVIETHGKDAISCYIGNPTAHNFSLGRYVGLFIGLAALPVVYSAGTVDQWPKNLTAALMYGGMWSIPTPDVPRTDHWIIMGGNPQASQGSLLACADILGELDGIRAARGGKVVVIDPRRTGTTERADEWIPIVPGTDAAFLLAMVNVLFADGLVDLGPLGDHVDGVEAVRAASADFPPERVESTCRIPAETIRRITHEYAAAPTAALYGRIGTCNQEFGTLTSWLVDVVNILTGNFDRPGGLMFGNPIAWGVNSLPNPALADGVQLGQWKSRVRGIPEVLGQVPVSCLAEEIDTPGPGQVRALVTIAGNPVISAPGAARLDAALDDLECMISIDNALNETTRHAHVLLPGLSALEQHHFDDLIPMWQVRSAQRFSEPVFDPGDRPHEWEILTRVGAMCAGIRDADIDVDAFDDGYFGALAEAKGITPAAAVAGSPGRGPLRLLDLQIRTGPWGDRYGEVPDGLSLQSFRDAPHGIDCGPMVPRVPAILETADQRIDLAPEVILADIPRLAQRVERGVDGLLLTSRRHLRSNNSWMHNVKVLVKGKDRCTLLIHPDDARATGVHDGALARVSSEAGSVEIPVEVSDEMMPGVVSMPHGWGHDKAGTRMAVAREHAGVNNNLLAPVDDYDPLSNNAAVNGIPVEVVPASTP